MKNILLFHLYFLFFMSEYAQGLSVSPTDTNAVLSADNQKERGLRFGADFYTDTRSDFGKMDLLNNYYHLRLGHYWRKNRWEIMPTIGYARMGYTSEVGQGRTHTQGDQGFSYGLQMGFFFFKSTQWEGLLSLHIERYENPVATPFVSLFLSPTLFHSIKASPIRIYLRPTFSTNPDRRTPVIGIGGGINWCLKYRNKDG